MPLIESEPDALAQIYARSLFDLVESKGGRAAVEETLAELEAIIELARKDARFSEFLASPSISTTDREASLGKILSGRVSDMTSKFFLVLNRKGRLANLAPIVAAMDHLAQAKFGRVEVDVYTAETMDDGTRNALKDRLSRVLNKEVILHPYLDPAMIGGVKLRIGDQLIDGSVATQLRSLQDKLNNEGAASLRTKMGEILG